MSHRDSCPSRYEAEREGERAQEHGDGRWRNPYDERYGNAEACEEASEAWSSGYRRAAYREEERREEEAREAQRVQMRRAESQADEDYAQAQQYYEEQDRREYEEAQPDFSDR